MLDMAALWGLMIRTKLLQLVGYLVWGSEPGSGARAARRWRRAAGPETRSMMAEVMVWNDHALWFCLSSGKIGVMTM